MVITDVSFVSLAAFGVGVRSLQHLSAPSRKQMRGWLVLAQPGSGLVRFDAFADPEVKGDGIEPPLHFTALDGTPQKRTFAPRDQPQFPVWGRHRRVTCGR